MRLDIPERNVITAAEMSRAEAAELLQTNLKETRHAIPKA
jgi:hypothetical protein